MQMATSQENENTRENFTAARQNHDTATSVTVMASTSTHSQTKETTHTQHSGRDGSASGNVSVMLASLYLCTLLEYKYCRRIGLDRFFLLSKCCFCLLTSYGVMFTFSLLSLVFKLAMLIPATGRQVHASSLFNIGVVV